MPGFTENRTLAKIPSEELRNLDFRAFSNKLDAFATITLDSDRYSSDFDSRYREFEAGAACIIEPLCYYRQRWLAFQRWLGWRGGLRRGLRTVVDGMRIAERFKTDPKVLETWRNHDHTASVLDQ